jgi:polyhydroxyalkanoate synthase
MQGANVVRDETVREVVHADRAVEVRRRALQIPASQGLPPLAVEQTVLPSGPTRPPVVLVHGFAQNRYTWRVSKRSLAARLAEEGYEVLNLELRGHGDSRAYGAGNASSFDDYVQDLARVVRACPTPPFVVGHSLGGGVCVGASTVAEVAGIVHLAGVYSFASKNRTIRALAKASLAGEKLLIANRVHVSTGWAGRVIGRLYGLADTAGFGFPLAGWAPGSVERDLLEERLRLGFDWTSLEVWLQMSRWALGERFAYADAFEKLDVPLLVMAGNADPLLHPEDAKKCFEGSGSRDKTFVELEPFEHEVHWGHLDLVLGKRAPDLVWPRIVGWLNARS